MNDILLPNEGKCDEKNIHLSISNISMEHDDEGQEIEQSKNPLLSSSSSSADSQTTTPSILMNKLEMKHPLEDQWSFWYLKNQANKDWQDNLMKIATFGSVEEFWALYNHLRVATRIYPGCDYMLFKSTILPCWEDPANTNGGRWVLYFSKSEQILIDLDVCWLASMLALVGGQYAKDTSYVNGVVLSARKNCDRIALWTQTAHDEQLIHRIGRRMRELINIPRNVHILFELHKQETRKKGSSNKALYQI